MEARWRLVETAWELRITQAALAISHDRERDEFFVGAGTRRVNLTSTRDALNGYQKGRCFFCKRDINISDPHNRPHVDHFFPHVLRRLSPDLAPTLDGVWNLVLACRGCNGAAEKGAQVPHHHYLDRLHRRNSFLIDSHHPLRETLIQQTGETEAVRVRFLNRMDSAAISLLIHRWSCDELTPTF